MNKFEQLIEYVINDEQAKAQELFHDIVVEKSRQIYENLMQEEEDIEEGADEDLEEGEEDLEEGLMDEVETDENSGMSMEGEEDDDMGGVAQDEFVSDVEVDDTEDSFGDDDGGSEPASKDDIMNLEDKLDQLMAEFEDLMGNDDGGMGGDGDGFGPEEGGDAIEMDDTEEMGMMEAVTLKAAPKPVTSEEGGVNKKSTVAANAGGKGPIGNSVKPVHAGGEMGGNHDAPAYKNTTKDLIGRVGNTPAQGTQNLKPATKPHLGQAAGVNTRTPFPRGK